jgi:hypothetical protein
MFLSGTFPLRKNPDDPKHYPSLKEWLQIFKKSIPSFRWVGNFKHTIGLVNAAGCSL